MSRGAVRWRCALSRTIDHSEIGSVSIDIHRLAEAEFRSDGTSEVDNVISPAWSVVVSNAEALPEATDDLGVFTHHSQVVQAPPQLTDARWILWRDLERLAVRAGPRAIRVHGVDQIKSPLANCALHLPALRATLALRLKKTCDDGCRERRRSDRHQDGRHIVHASDPVDCRRRTPAPRRSGSRRNTKSVSTASLATDPPGGSRRCADYAHCPPTVCEPC